MLNFKRYIELHKETIIVLLVLSFLNTFAIYIFHEKNNLFSLIYMTFVIIITIKILFNKMNV